MSEAVSAGIAREKMVDSQVRPNQVNDRRVIAAMRALPREAFAPPGALAYSDADISLGGGRYMLNPMLAARLAQLVLANDPEHVLVIGAGSGYLAAVLALAGAKVVALESETRLMSKALAQYAPGVEAVVGKLVAGWPAGGPYDVILIEGAVQMIPDILAAQLAPAGRVVTIMADTTEEVGLGRAVIAEPSAGAFACVDIFDCTARVLPEFRRAPVFSF